jgi:hypothetical protein
MLVKSQRALIPAIADSLIFQDLLANFNFSKPDVEGFEVALIKEKGSCFTLRLAKVMYDAQVQQFRWIHAPFIAPDTFRDGGGGYHNTFIRWLNEEFFDDVRRAHTSSFVFYFLWDETVTPVWLFKLATQFSVDVMIPEIEKKYLTDKSFKRIIVPEYHTMEKVMLTAVAKASLMHVFDKPFQSRIGKLYFRGVPSGTGNQQLDPPETSGTRVHLAKLTNLFPDLVDAKFVGYQYLHPLGESPTLLADFKKTFGDRPQLNFQHWTASCSYKYVAAPDGWAAAWLRTWLAFRSGSILFDNSDYVQFATMDAKPFVNFIPIEKDCSDCIKWVTYLENNPDVALKISEQSRLLGTKINEDQIRNYWKNIINYLIIKYTP